MHCKSSVRAADGIHAQMTSNARSIPICITGINLEAVKWGDNHYDHPLCPGLQPGPPSQTPGGLGQSYWSVSEVTWPPELELRRWRSSGPSSLMMVLSWYPWLMDIHFTQTHFQSHTSMYVDEILIKIKLIIIQENCICKIYMQEISENCLTHWGRVTHICVSILTIIASDNGLSPGRRQAIIWTNDGILLIWALGTNFSEILNKIHSFSFKKMHLKMSSAKGRLFSLSLNELKASMFKDFNRVICGRI